MTAVYLDHNARALLVFREGRRHVYAVALSHGNVRVVKFEKRELPQMRAAEFRGKPYPVKRAVRHFKSMAKSLGSTPGAVKALKEITHA